MDTYEETLVTRYRNAKAAYEEVSKEVLSHFMLLALDAIKRGEIAEAREIQRRCPDFVTFAFISDVLSNR